MKQDEASKRKLFRRIILGAMAAHLLVINTNLLINLTTYFKAEQNSILQIVLAVLFSIMYSFGTVYTLDRPGAVLLKIFFALLDGCAVGLWYNSTLQGDQFIWYVSSFYVVFTISVALGVGILPKTKEKKVSKEPSYKFLAAYISGFMSWQKWKFNKTKEDKKLKVAEEFGLLLDNFETNLDELTITNLEDIKNEVGKFIRERKNIQG